MSKEPAKTVTIDVPPDVENILFFPISNEEHKALQALTRMVNQVRLSRNEGSLPVQTVAISCYKMGFISLTARTEHEIRTLGN